MCHELEVARYITLGQSPFCWWAACLEMVSKRAAPHPTSLREATFSSFVEKDSPRSLALISRMVFPFATALI
jgi:hypothetical protein